MINGIVAKKVGMTRFFMDQGMSKPVTILKFEGCILLKYVNEERVQVSYGLRKTKNISKSIKSSFDSVEVKSVGFCKEFLVLDKKALSEKYKVGDSISMSDIISVGDRISVSSMTKGKGFQGVVKRYGFSGGRKSHGSRFHRAPGSIGACATPSRVFKGTRLPGRMGFSKNMIKNLVILDFDLESELIYVSGSVSGSVNSSVYIKK